jgi:hypothetical protein
VGVQVPLLAFLFLNQIRNFRPSDRCWVQFWVNLRCSETVSAFNHWRVLFQQESAAQVAGETELYELRRERRRLEEDRVLAAYRTKVTSLHQS